VSSKKSKGKKRVARLRYDAKTKRFRDAQGRFVSYDRGIRSAPARRQYNRVPKKRRYLPPVPIKAVKRKALVKPKAPPKPVKKKPAPSIKKRRKPAPPPPKPTIFEVTQAPGQFMVLGVESYTSRQLADLILKQIELGATVFRFWYRMAQVSEAYPLGVGSTQPLHKSILTLHDDVGEIVRFILGRHRYIKGDITEYWFSFRPG